MLHPPRLVLQPPAARRAPACLARHRAFVSRFGPAARAASRARPLLPVLLRRRGTAMQAAGSTWFAPSWTWVVSPRPPALQPGARAAVPAAVHLHHGVTMLRRVTPAMPALRLHTMARIHARLERTVTWLERHTSAPTVHVLRTTRIERHAAYPRVSVVLSRPPAPAAAAGSERIAATVQPAVRSGHAPAVPLSLPAAREPLPPHELARVTDHVLAQLDRKVLSYRERHGHL